MQAKFDSFAENKRAGPLWIATQVQSEFLRFRLYLSDYLSGNGNVTADDIRFRFDILWSRVTIALDGQEGQPAARYSDSFSQISIFMGYLRSVDATVQALEGENRTIGLTLSDGFSDFSNAIQEYVLDAKDEQSVQDAAARDEYQRLSERSFILGILVGLASLLNAALFYVDYLREKKLASHNKKLAGEAQAGVVAKSNFISTVSHELRTPLTSIKGALAILDAGYAGILPDKAKGLISTAHRNSSRLTTLINDILDFERISMDRMEFRSDIIALNDAVLNAINDNATFMQECEVTIISELPDEDICIAGDQMRIEQVLANLISNAIKFSDQGGEVIVRLDVGDRAVVRVQDFGIGISKDFHDKLFERFSQIDASETRRHGGSGLGLSIAKSITEAHDGKIYFESELGVGTIFFLEFPLVEKSATRNAVA